MLADARTHGLVVTAEDGIADGGVGAAIVAALSRIDGDAPMPPTITLGTPLAFLPHGKPDDLLANLGLDGPGIAATVLKALDVGD
jgi:1-deoxy-D-xylulose-5-phosphate synthase